MATRVFERQINRSVAADIVYPIGSIYMSVNNISPQTMFSGTTWVRLEDRFLVAAGSEYIAGSTGGDTSQTINLSGSIAAHTLTVDEIPSHTHTLNNHAHDSGTYETNETGSHTHSAQGWRESSGSGQQTLTHVRTRFRDTARNNSGVSGDTYGMASAGAHIHTLDNFMAAASGNTASYGNGGSHTHSFTGQQSNIDILPPYLPVYMWKRTA